MDSGAVPRKRTRLGGNGDSTVIWSWVSDQCIWSRTCRVGRVQRVQQGWYRGVSIFTSVPFRGGLLFARELPGRPGNMEELMLETLQTSNGTAPSNASRYRPSLDEVAKLRERGNIIPIYREIMADLETPVTAYLKVAQGPYSFLLESVEGGERLARYLVHRHATRISSLRLNDGVLTATAPARGQAGLPLHRSAGGVAGVPDAVPARRTPGMDLPRFLGGAVGYLGYECIRYFEPRVPMAADDVLGLPDAVFMLTDTLLVFDHLRRTIKVVIARPYGHRRSRRRPTTRRSGGSTGSSAQLRSGVADPAARRAPDRRRRRGAWCGNFTRDGVRGGGGRARRSTSRRATSSRSSRRSGFASPTSAAPFTIYRALRAINPSPYMYFLDFGDYQIVGASPETAGARRGRHDRRRTRSPARGRAAATGGGRRALARGAARDEKERAEHIMLVDLGRNDVGRVAEPGTVRVAAADGDRALHPRHAHRLGRGRAAARRSSRPSTRCAPASRPAPSRGAPKIRAMEIIAELERERRGPYAGAVGYFGFDGELDTASPSARWSSRTASPTCRPAPASSPTAARRRNTTNATTRWAPCCGPSRLPSASSARCEMRHRHDSAH